MITFYACVPYVYINLWLVTAKWHFVALHCIAMSLSAQWQKSFPIPFHLGMSTSNLRAKQLIGLMVIEDWRYCPLFYHQNWRSHSWNLNLFISFYLFLAHILTQQIFIHQIVLQSWVDNVDLSVGVFTFLAEDFNLKIDKKFINIIWDLTKARSVGDFAHTSRNPPIQLCLQFTCQLQ